jgi:hypothetical protein
VRWRASGGGRRGGLIIEHTLLSVDGSALVDEVYIWAVRWLREYVGADGDD